MIRYGLIVCLFASLFTGTSLAQSWPTYRHDNRRSGVTDAKLEFPLSVQWVWKSPTPPQTAWAGPAKWDAYSGNAGLQSMRNFDPCFFVTADQDSVFFGSSADDAAHALDLKTGVERWVHFSGAAVRLPPTISGSRVLFGSDDGFVYCCDRRTGDVVWRRRAAATNQRITSDRKIISMWPVRTGVLIHGDRATFAASLVPWQKSVLWTVNVDTGEADDDACFRREVTEVTLQGALLASEELIYVPQGRAAPLAFSRADGAPRGTVGEAGGVFCILSEDEMLFAGPPNQRENEDQIRIASIGSETAIASFGGTDRILVAGDDAWLSVGGELKMLDRKSYVAASRAIEQATGDLKNGKGPAKTMRAVIDRAKAKQQSSWKWSVSSTTPLDMIKAGDAIVVGLDGEVRAYSATGGSELWRASVDGAVYGLAVAANRLLVSTDGGQIYAFGAAR